ncbi:hypothetical protein Godav_003136, partial [Gossypium davidsonii]|nr:hypothetical protein [Gossypium davidsonii]
MVFTFYKGIDINIWSTNVNLLKHHHQQVGPRHSYHGTGHLIIGAFFGLLSCISFSLWLINQCGVPLLVFKHCFDVFDGINTRSFVRSLYCEGLESMEAWGIMGSALLVFLVSWAVRLKGPLYAAIFNPLGLVFVAIVGSLLLDEKLHLG